MQIYLQFVAILRKNGGISGGNFPKIQDSWNCREIVHRRQQMENKYRNV